MIGIFITARLGSTRLPEKHLIEVNGKPFIKWLVERFSFAFEDFIRKNELKIFIVTSVKKENVKFETVFNNNEVEIFYGSDGNIPLRHLECSIKHNIDYIISIDGDDILCSTEAAKLVIERLLKGASMAQTFGLPLGMNISGYSKLFLNASLQRQDFQKLETGWGKIFDNAEIDLINLENGKDLSKIRMTLDYLPDSDFFEKVITNIDVFNISDKNLIEAILKNNWNQINEQLNEIYWNNFNKLKQEEL